MIYIRFLENSLHVKRFVRLIRTGTPSGLIYDQKSPGYFTDDQKSHIPGVIKEQSAVAAVRD